MARVFVSVGSNIDKSNNIRSALRALRAAFAQVIVSPVYRSKAVGFDGDDFFNLAVGFDTDLTPQAMVDFLHKIEADHGRERHDRRFDSRTLDIDLLLYDDLILQEGDLELPRGEILEYAHVLKPLVDIAGDRRHPVLGTRFVRLFESLDIGVQSLSPVSDFLE